MGNRPILFYYVLSTKMNLQQVVHDIRSRVMREAAWHATPTAADRALSPLSEQIARLRLSYEQLFAIRNTVGRMPPSPNTWRARTGAILIRLVQRTLFWHTPQIRQFNNATAAVAENVCAAMEKQVGALERIYAEVGELRREQRVRNLSVPTEPDPGSADGSPKDAGPNDAGFDQFLFALQNSLLGPEEHCAAELRDYMAAIGAATPPIPDGPWLDLECGRGDWLKAIQSAGRVGIGLSRNAAALSHCVNLGLHAVGADPLEYLRRGAESSYAVIAAFHLLAHYPAIAGYRLIGESVRALKPGGILIVESADPASLAAGAHEAWFDPTHLRPVPAFTAEFLLQYFGLTVIMRKRLRAIPQERHLPFAELDMVRQLNSLLYGPRAYALIARRVGTGGEPGESDGQGAVA